MSINIQLKQDVSFLFSSLGSGAAGVAGSNFLSDYASIKNGSYMKLMKAYYGESSNDSVKNVANSKTNSMNNRSKSANKLTDKESKEYAKVQTTSDALKESADALLATGSKSLFNKVDITTKNEDGSETTEKGYDVERIYKAVNEFVKNYNSVINAVEATDSNTVLRRAATMVNETVSNMKSLLSMGITINADNTLSLDKNEFMKADMSKVKTLFNGSGSYAYSVSAQASMINFAADRELDKGTYTFSGSYGSGHNSGNLFNGYF